MTKLKITPYAYTLSHIDENGVTGAVLAIFNEFVDYLNTLSNSEIRGSTCKQYVFSMLGAILAALPPPIRTTLKLKLKLTSASDPPVGLTTDSLKVALVETVKEIFKTNDIEVIALLGAKPDTDCPATFCGAEKKFKKCKRGAKCNFAKHHVAS